VLPVARPRKLYAVSTAMITIFFLISIIILLPPTVRLLASMKKSYISEVRKPQKPYG
jgi:hypothetical protein